MSEIIVRLLRLIDTRDKLVKVQSWRPYWDGRFICWPTLLIDQAGIYRRSVSPCWNWPRIKSVLRIIKP